MSCFVNTVSSSIFKIIIFCYVLFASFITTAQTKNTATHYNGWFMYFGNHRLTEKVGIHTEYQWRRNEIVAHWQQSLLRVGVDWHVDKKIALTGGYGWIKSFPYGQQPIPFAFNEHRIWQQLVLQHETNRFYFHHRYRLEQRFLENIVVGDEGHVKIDGFNFRNRARYRFMCTVPITRPELNDNTLFFSVYDEVFLGFGKGIGKNILDQNRCYFALGWRFTKDFNVQLGYLNQYVIKADGIQYERNHTLQVALQFNFDLTKEKREK